MPLNLTSSPPTLVREFNTLPPGPMHYSPVKVAVTGLSLLFNSVERLVVPMVDLDIVIFALLVSILGYGT